MLNLGSSYWEATGLEKDLIQAYKWLELARFGTTFSKDMQLKWRIRGLLDQVKNEMPREQIKEGNRLASEWDKTRAKKIKQSQ